MSSMPGATLGSNDGMTNLCANMGLKWWVSEELMLVHVIPNFIKAIDK